MDSRSAKAWKQGRDDSIKQFTIQPHPTYIFTLKEMSNKHETSMPLCINKSQSHNKDMYGMQKSCIGQTDPDFKLQGSLSLALCRNITIDMHHLIKHPSTGFHFPYLCRVNKYCPQVVATVIM